MMPFSLMEKDMDKAAVLFQPYHHTVSTVRGTNLLALMQAEGIAVDAVCGGRGICGKCLVRIGGKLRRACSVEVNADLEVELMPGTSAVLPRTSYGGAHTFDPQIRVLFEEGGWRVKNGGRILRSCKERPSAYMAAADIGTTTIAACLIDADDGRVIGEAGCRNPQTAFGADVITRAGYALRHAELPGDASRGEGYGDLTACVRRAVRDLIKELAADAGVKTEEIYAVSVAGNTCMHHFFFGLPIGSLVQAPYVPCETAAMVRDAGGILGGAVNPGAVLFALPNLAGFVGGDTAACLISTRILERKEWTLLVDIGTNGEMVLSGDGRAAVCSAAAGPAFEGEGIGCGMRAEEGAILHVSEADDEPGGADGSPAGGDSIFHTAAISAHGRRIYENRWRYEVMGGGAPKGICGSGLLDAAALLLKEGRIDASGRFLEGSEAVLYQEGSEAVLYQESSEAVLYQESSEAVLYQEGGKAALHKEGTAMRDHSPNMGGTISLTQRDISQLQLAKAAIAAGIRLLAGHMGIEIREISEVLLAGAFGNYLDPKSACAIGLIPPELKDRIRPIGNAAEAGAIEVLRDRSAWEYGTKLPDRICHLELAALPDFQEVFIRELQFPARDA